MSRRNVALAVLAVNIGAAVIACSDEPAPPLERVDSFAFAIGEHALDESTRLARYDLVVVDGETAPRELVADLRDGGALVLGYLSVGTIEPGRAWYTDAEPYRLERWDDWGEYYADTSRAGFRRLLLDEVAPAILDRGFDGLFLDNVDMIGDHPDQTDGMVALVTALGRLAHDRSGVLMAQNGEQVIEPMLGSLDAWNREDVTSTYDFDDDRYERVATKERHVAQHALREIAADGLLVTATDYTERGTGSVVGDAVRNACAAGALPYVSDIDLERVPEHPPRCDAENDA